MLGGPKVLGPWRCSKASAATKRAGLAAPQWSHVVKGRSAARSARAFAKRSFHTVESAIRSQLGGRRGYSCMRHNRTVPSQPPDATSRPSDEMATDRAPMSRCPRKLRSSRRPGRSQTRTVPS
jgi:hypothetical protein